MTNIISPTFSSQVAASSENKRPALSSEEQEHNKKIRKVTADHLQKIDAQPLKEQNMLEKEVENLSATLPSFPRTLVFQDVDFVLGLQKFQDSPKKIPALIESIRNLHPELKYSPNVAALLNQKLLTYLLPQMFFSDSQDVFKMEVCNIPDDFDANVEKSYTLSFVTVSSSKAFICIKDSSNGAENKGAFRTFKKAIEFDDFNVRLTAQLELTNIKKLHPGTCIMEKPDFTSDNVLQILHISQSAEHHIVYSEYMNGGDLYSFLKENSLSFEEKLEISRDALNGINDMHKNGYMHRDIKASNFLIQTEDKICNNIPSRKVVKTKIGDLDTLIKEIDPRAHNTDDFGKYCPILAGTPSYIPQESIENDKRTKSDDIYAFGKTLKEDVFPEIFSKNDLSSKEIAFKQLIDQLYADKAVDRLGSEAALEALDKILEPR